MHLLAIAASLLPWLLVVAMLAVAWREVRARHIIPLQGRGKVLPGQIVEPGTDTPAEADAGSQADAEYVAQLQAELARVRGQVARLEDVTGRPVEAVIASYEQIQRKYGPAAVGKTGGAP
jgi:hypothetical protein